MYILTTNVLPCFTTFMACCNRQISDNICLCLLVDDFCCSHLVTSLRIRSILSLNWRISILCTIPIKVRHVSEPLTFSKANIPLNFHRWIQITLSGQRGSQSYCQIVIQIVVRKDTLLDLAIWGKRSAKTLTLKSPGGRS